MCACTCWTSTFELEIFFMNPFQPKAGFIWTNHITMLVLYVSIGGSLEPGWSELSEEWRTIMLSVRCTKI